MKNILLLFAFFWAGIWFVFGSFLSSWFILMFQTHIDCDWFDERLLHWTLYFTVFIRAFFLSLLGLIMAFWMERAHLPAKRTKYFNAVYIAAAIAASLGPVFRLTILMLIGDAFIFLSILFCFIVAIEENSSNAKDGRS